MILDPFIDHHDESFRVSVSLFFAGSFLTTIGLYTSEPIECISEPWLVEVIDSYCFVHSTFTIPRRWNESELVAHPGVESQGESDVIKFHLYYQWICYLLGVLAILFYIPRGLWKYYFENGKLRTLLSLAKEDEVDSNKFLKYFVENIGQHQSYFGKHVLCEVLNLGVTFIQMSLIRVTDFSYKDAIRFITMNDPLEREDFVAQIFPKITKCTFEVFGPSGTLQNIDALCVLPFNQINEKIFLGIWLWLGLLASLSFMVLSYRLCLVLIPTFRIAILKHSTKYKEIGSFGVLRNKLKVGDWFVLRTLSKNMDFMEFTKLVISLKRKLMQKNTTTKI